MPSGQTDFYKPLGKGITGIERMIALYIQESNINREAIDEFLPASLSRTSEAKSRESAGKMVCARLRLSAVKLQLFGDSKCTE